MFKFLGTSVSHHDGVLVVHTPVSLMGCILAVVLAFFILVLLAGLTANPFRSANVKRTVVFYLVRLGLLALATGFLAVSVKSNDLVLDARAHTATETDRYLFFFKSTNTYDLSRIQHAEVYGSRNGGADRLCLVFVNGHVHSLTGNSMKYGKEEAAGAINSYLATAQ